jgi:uncharacterized protein YjiK
MKNVVTNVSLFSILSFTIIGTNVFGMSRNLGELANYSKVDEVILLPEIGGNLSGITYNYDTGTYFMVQNNYGKLFEYDRSLKKQLRVIEMKNLKDDDTEGIFYLGRDRFAISSEDNHIHIFTIRPGDTVIDLDSAREDVQDLTLPPPSKSNQGIEGICHAPAKNGGRGTFYAVQEAKPKKVYYFDFPASDADVTSPKALGVKELFNADRTLFLKMGDLSDCTFDTESDHLFLLSHESSKVMEFSRTGEELGSLKLPNVAPQYEGITFGPDRELILVSEPNSVVIMKRNR